MQPLPGPYTGADIRVLEGLEAVRKRPGMYIGNTDVYGLHHMIYELVDNSVDEALAGYCDRIEITIHADHSVTVSDNGRGIPVDLQPQMNKSALEVVLTVLHAGGKFGGGGYKVSSGLHGVGASVVNALERMAQGRGAQRRQPLPPGVPRRRARSSPSERVGDTSLPNGTTITFLADNTIFTTLDYGFDTLAAAVPRDGVPDQGPEHHAARRAAWPGRRARVDVLLRGRHRLVCSPPEFEPRAAALEAVLRGQEGRRNGD